MASEVGRIIARPSSTPRVASHLPRIKGVGLGGEVEAAWGVFDAD
jgi:hypothetical protein